MLCKNFTNIFAGNRKNYNTFSLVFLISYYVFYRDNYSILIFNGYFLVIFHEISLIWNIFFMLKWNIFYLINQKSENLFKMSNSPKGSQGGQRVFQHKNMFQNNAWRSAFSYNCACIAIYSRNFSIYVPYMTIDGQYLSTLYLSTVLKYIFT